MFDEAVGFLRTKFGTLALLILGPLAPMAFLALHWQQIWNGMITVIGLGAGSAILQSLRLIGDAFFSSVQAILGAASHLPFVGSKFAEAETGPFMPPTRRSTPT